MAVDVEGITPGLGSSVEQEALPFDATESSQMTMWTTHNVVEDKSFSSAAVHLSSFLSDISRASERFVPIHSASFVGSQHNTGFALQNSQVIHSDSGSKSSSCTTPSLSAVYNTINVSMF